MHHLATPPQVNGQTPPSFAPPVLVRPVLVDNMDGPSPVLRPLQTDNGFNFGQRIIDRNYFRRGTGAERIHLRGPAGRTAQLGYELPSAPVIQELQLRAKVLSNRAGILLAAKVVLPRSTNRATGHPFELLVRGTSVGAGGEWEELALVNLPQLLANHARVARAQYGAALDERGAYVSQIVFLTPGGAGTTELIVDQIQVFGVLSGRRRNVEGPRIEQASAQQSPARSAIATTASPAVSKITSRVPRIIQWQGEPFHKLQRLGFNTIGMNRLPSAEELKEIDQLGLSLVCPPPLPQQLSEQGIGAEFEPVVAWDLGEQLSSDDLAYVQRWEQLVARHDPIVARPTVLAPQLFTLEASRISDILLIGRAVVGTAVTLREHAAWLAQRQRLARPGTPIWNKIETQISPSQQMQSAALSSNGTTMLGTSYAHLTALTSASLGVKSRGLYFQSHSPLFSEETVSAKEPAAFTDSAARRRALALELTNLRLQLAEPWMAAGKELFVARSTQPEVSALVMQAERSHLLAPVWWSSNMQFSTTTRTAGPISFIVPSVAESSEAFLVTLGGMERVGHQRVTGGIRVSLEKLPFDSFLLFSDDPQAISQVTQYLRRVAPRAAKLRRELAYLHLQEATSLLASLQAFTTSIGQAQITLAQARGELTACDRYLTSGGYDLAYLRADAVDLAIDQLESELQAALLWPQSQAITTLNHGPSTLPVRLQLQKVLARAPLSANLLAGGGFENLSSLLETGWRHRQLPLDGITTTVRLSPEAPHSGSYCLELEARALEDGSPTTIVPTAPVWISSAPLHVGAGDLLEITGVARLPEPLIGSVDGLQIIDSIGGADMALRIHEAPSWQPFRLIRAATSDGDVSVTIALSGLGKAQVDDVAIRVIKLPNSGLNDQAAYGPPARPR